MAQVLIRDLDDDVVERLRNQARDNGRSLESELRIALTELSKQDKAEWVRGILEMRARLAGRKFSDSTELIREDRER